MKGQVLRWTLGGTSPPSPVAEFELDSTCAVLSPGAKLAAFADQQGRVAIFDLATKKQLVTIPATEGRAVAMAFTRDARLLSW